MNHYKSVGFLVILFFLLAPRIAFGHALNESYIYLDPHEDRFKGNVQFRIEDLRKFFKLEIPEDTPGAQKSIEAYFPEIEKYILARVRIETMDGVEIPIHFTKIEILELKNENVGKFAKFLFESVVIEVPSNIRVHSTLLFDFNNYSQCLLCNNYNGFTGKTHPESFYHHVFNPNRKVAEVDYNNLKQVKFGRRYFTWEGIRHIWIGTDHILFLIALLLPSVLYKRESGVVAPAGSEAPGTSVPTPIKNSDEALEKPLHEWVPVESFQRAFWNVFKIVTIFTIAHSITLALASLGFIVGEPRIVESIIALSIVLVAINNIIPTFRDKTWVILFVFGLVHGMGFASVMQDLPYRMMQLPTLLVCFNLGVELGQMVIVAAVFPIIYLLRKTLIYKPVILIGGSMVLCMIAGYWFIERAMGWG